MTKDARMPNKIRQTLIAHLATGIAISVISCWEVAKLVSLGRWAFSVPVSDWIDESLKHPQVTLFPITPHIAVESTVLPGTFHRDPADQLIVATARIHDLPLLTMDKKILQYQYVKLVAS